MAKNLTDKIEQLAADFARAVVASLRTTSLAEIAGVPVAAATVERRGKPAKRSSKPRTRQWPKCPECGKNAYPKGKGYCFEHAKAGMKRAAKSPKKAVKAKKTTAKSGAAK